jgi:hypothetical protein
LPSTANATHRTIHHLTQPTPPLSQPRSTMDQPTQSSFSAAKHSTGENTAHFSEDTPSSPGDTPRQTYAYDGSHGESIAQVGPKYRRRVVGLGFLLALISIVNIAMCCYYSYIFGACTQPNTDPSFIVTCKYDSGTDWQACFAQAGTTGGKFGSSFAPSMAFLGQQTLIYVWLAYAILFRSLCHYEWLPSSISFMLYAVIGVTAYYSFHPFIPFPHQTAATVVTLGAYIQPDMYNDLKTEDDDFDKHLYPVCDKAYHYNLAFLIVQYCSAAIVVLLLCVGFSANRIRLRYPIQNPLPPLQKTTMPIIVAGMCLILYAVGVGAKAHASLTALKIFKAADSSAFPFTNGSVDICTVFLITSTMSVIRGHSRSSTSAFRLAAVAAVLHVALIYPSILGNLETMNYNEIWHKNQCKEFWQSYYKSEYNSLGLAPTDHQATSLCHDTWISTISELSIFTIMHFQVIFCALVYKSNKGRPTDIYDPQPPTVPGYLQEPLLANNKA